MATALDLTPYSNMTQEQFISSVHNMTAVPSLIILWLFTMIVLLIVGLASTKNKQKFMAIFGLTFVASGIVCCMLIFLPNVVHGFALWVKSFFF